MIQILQENDFFLVLNKPEGMSVHNEKPSVLEFLQSQKLPIHFVNRLDRETSGLMVVAKTATDHTRLTESLTHGLKTYRALARGQWKPTELTTWSWPLTDKAEGRDNPQGKTAERVPCESQIQLVRTNKYFSEILVTILTGRQHQIRKHAALANHPLVGDGRYNDKKYNKLIEDRYKLNRLWLHSEALSFEFQNEKFEFKNSLDLNPFFT